MMATRWISDWPLSRVMWVATVWIAANLLLAVVWYLSRR